MARWLAEDTHRLAEWETDLSSQTGASQAGILLGSNEDISAFRWVEKETGDADDVLGAAGLRGDRAAARDRHRPARRRRRQPRQPALRRGGGRDPHRQPDGGGEEVQPRLPGVLRQRRQRDAHARPLRLGGHPRVDRRAARDPPRRAAARPPRRHLPVDARGALRLRARPDRLRRPHRHDARATRRLRDVLELRRGRAPLGPRARRHARGAAQARRPVRRRSSERAATRRGRTRSSSSPTTGRRRARPSSSATATASTSSSSARSRRATSTGSPAATSRARWSATPSARRPARRRSEPKNDVSDRDVVVLGSGNLGLVYLMEERRRLTLEEIDERHPQLIPALRAHPHVGWLLVRSSEHGAVALGAHGAHYLADGPRRGRGSARALLAAPPRSTCCAPTASSTSPTSWSAASTTPSSTRAARSRS